MGVHLHIICGGSYMFMLMSVCVCLCMHVCSVVTDSATPRTVAHQALLSVGFPRQEHWSGLPFPPPDMQIQTRTTYVLSVTQTHMSTADTFTFGFGGLSASCPRNARFAIFSLVSPPHDVTRLLPGRGLQSVIPGSHTLTCEWLLRWSVGRMAVKIHVGLSLVAVCLMSPGVLFSFQIVAPLSTKAAEKV